MPGFIIYSVHWCTFQFSISNRAGIISLVNSCQVINARHYNLFSLVNSYQVVNARLYNSFSLVNSYQVVNARLYNLFSSLVYFSWMDTIFLKY